MQSSKDWSNAFHRQFGDPTRLAEAIREICLLDYARGLGLSIADAREDLNRVKAVVRDQPTRSDEDREAEKVLSELLATWRRVPDLLTRAGAHPLPGQRFLLILQSLNPYLSFLEIAEEEQTKAAFRQEIDFELTARKRLVNLFASRGDGGNRSDQELAVMSILIGIPEIRATPDSKKSPAQVLFAEIKAIFSARRVLTRFLETASP